MIVARNLHDRFCKFEAVFKPGDSISIVRSISKIVPIDILNQVDLPFKLNSLRWFLTPKGKEFLQLAHKQVLNKQKREKLDKKLDQLDISNIVLG